jgi:hypothetical protein
VELLAAFFIGWAVGSRGGERGYREVVDAARDLRNSAEFRALLDALRSHMAGTLRALAEVLGDKEVEVTTENVVERVMRLMSGPTSGES